LYEDEMFSVSAVYQAKRFMHIGENIYFYRANPKSQINRSFGVKNYLTLLDVAAECFDFCRKIECESPTFSQKLKTDIALEHIDFSCREIPYLNRCNRRTAIQTLVPYLREITQSGYFGGWKAFYFHHFRFVNAVFVVSSPFFRLVRQAKTSFRALYKKIKRRIKKIIRK